MGKGVKWVMHSDKLSEEIPTPNLWFLGDGSDKMSLGRNIENKRLN